MPERNNLTRVSTQRDSVAKPILLGALIAFMLTAVFLLTAGDPDPNWPKLWMVRPLVIVPLAGAVGGAFYTFMNPFRAQGGWKKTAANILCVIVYIVGLWLGTVLGLDGTMWD